MGKIFVTILAVVYSKEQFAHFIVEVIEGWSSVRMEEEQVDTAIYYLQN